MTFFSFRTTVAISKETSESLPPPTIVLCQENKWDNGFRFPWLEHQLVNMSDKYWLFNQFYRLKDKMNISIFDVELMIGNNSFSLPKGIKKLAYPIYRFRSVFEHAYDFTYHLVYAIIGLAKWVQ